VSKFDTHCARFVPNIRAVPDRFKEKSLKEVRVVTVKKNV